MAGGLRCAGPDRDLLALGEGGRSYGSSQEAEQQQRPQGTDAGTGVCQVAT